jgi:3'-5' exoribonuclease
VRIDSWVRPGGYVGVRGRIQSFRNQRQLKIEEIAPIHVASDELDLFLPATPLDLATLEAGLDALIASIEDRPLRQLVKELAGADTATGRAFRRAPAAKRNHHAYVGGLLEHTLSIARVADALARHYGETIDRDLLITGAILHDIGKIEEIAVTGGFPYTDPGKLLGHILLGIELVREAGRAIPELDEERLLLVLHLIASHQGKYEWQSPRVPHTLEAIILHFADDLDAKVNQATALINAVEEGWTAYDGNFGRDFFRHRGTAPQATTGTTMTGEVPRTGEQGREAPPKRAARKAPRQSAPEPQTQAAPPQDDPGQEEARESLQQVSIFDLL